MDGLASTETWAAVAHRCEGFVIPKGISGSDAFVCILDPATGTGTFLYECIELIEQFLKTKWCKELSLVDWNDRVILDRWSSYVSTHLLPRLYGYELMMAPYAIAHLRLTLRLADTGYRLTQTDRLNIYLADSLASPTVLANPKLADMFTSLATEASLVGEVQRRTRFTVVVGNPPYLREKERGPEERLERIGGWVRFGDVTAKRALFDDFVGPLASRNLGVHAKLAYELSVFFWRLAMWTVFEKHSGPGIVAMISPRAYISGPGHTGMREWMRHHANHIWIIDLGGDNRGARKSENIFEIETGVAIGLCVKAPPGALVANEIQYCEVTGSAVEKLGALGATTELGRMKWKDCSKAPDVFLPSAAGDYSSWPKLSDIFPWQHSGSQFKRLWPIAESADVLRKRWHRLLELPRDKRAAAFIETRDRVVGSHGGGGSSKRYTGITDLKKGAPCPRILRYCYRSLDRQWCIADERLADFLRPALVRSLGPRQVFAATLMSKTLGSGPAVSVTNCLPDMDVFCNRGAKDVIPLWLDAEGTRANVTRGVLAYLGDQLASVATAEDLFCYCVAVLGGPAYTSTFADELATPGIRIPLSTDPIIFRRGTLLGARMVWLQTFGEMWLSTSKNRWHNIHGSIRQAKPISGSAEEYPSTFSYDEPTKTLSVGDGVFNRVAPEVFNFSISGFKVVQSWLRYRMAQRGGRARREGSRSELDEIRPNRWTFSDELLQFLWVVESCLELGPELTAFLVDAVDGPLVDASVLPCPTTDERKEPEATDGAQGKLV